MTSKLKLQNDVDEQARKLYIMTYVPGMQVPVRITRTRYVPERYMHWYPCISFFIRQIQQFTQQSRTHHKNSSHARTQQNANTTH